LTYEWHCNLTRYRRSHRQKATSKSQLFLFFVLFLKIPFAVAVFF